MWVSEREGGREGRRDLFFVEDIFYATRVNMHRHRDKKYNNEITSFIIRDVNYSRVLSLLY